jgi:type I restriction enzyme, S subunit
MATATRTIPKGYKQTEVGVIPSDWEIGTLGSECDLITKGTTPTSVGRDFKKSGINFIKIESLDKKGNIIKDKVAFIDDETHGLLKRSQLESGDLLFSIAGALGRAAVVSDHILPANTNQALAIIRLNRRGVLQSAYVLHFLSTQQIKKHVESISVQGAQANISLQNVNDLPIAFPRAGSEQTAIATALSDADELIEKLTKLIEKKKNIKQGAMQELLIGKCRLPGFSGKWEVKKLGEIAHIKTGGRNNQDKKEDGIYPFFVRSQSIERIGSYSYDCEAILVPGEGNIGNIFHYINGRFDVHQRVYAITNFDGIVCGKYIYFHMLKNFGVHAMQNTVKATVDSLRLPTFENFEMRIPDKEEQIAIASVLSDMDTEIERLESQLAKYQNLKQGMMQTLLTGKIRLI